MDFQIKQLCVVPPPYGGVTIHVKRLVDNLTRDGFIVGAYYGAGNVNPRLKNSVLFDKMYSDNGATYVRKFFSHILRLARMCRQASPYKVVHSHSGLEDMLLVWLLHKVCGKKVVVTVHNAMSDNFYGRMPSLNRFFLKRNARSDIRWIAVSRQAKDSLLRLPLTFRNEIDVIPAYIPGDVNLSRPLPEAMDTYIAGHNKIISFYGHSFMLHEGRDVYGFTVAIDLYERLCHNGYGDVGLILCVQEISDAGKMKDLHEYARQHNVDDKIYWQEGPLDNMLCLWHKTDVYIRPTSTDGDSVAVREVLDMGAKVVASDVCPRPEGVILYKFGNIASLYDGVLSSLSQDRGGLNQNFKYYHSLRTIYQDLLLN